jgi:DNA-binding NarL/FixJ family response regulator
MSSSAPIRVLVADDHPLVLDGLRALIGGSATTELVGEATTGAEAVARALETTPDVVVMDIGMPELNGIEATRRLAAELPATAVLVLTMLEEDDAVFAAMRAGARGYVLKGAKPTEILRAIEAIADGSAIFGPAVARRLIAALAASSARPRRFPELTAREHDILALMAERLGNAAIAARLGLSEKTIRNNVSSIYLKLRVLDREAAIARARDAGLEAPD